MTTVPVESNELPKLYFSPYSKDVVKMLYECATELNIQVGLICSRSQVNCEALGAPSRGYTGFTQRTLAAFVQDLARGSDTDWAMPLCRDHLGKVEDENLVTKIVKADESAGFKVVHLHMEDVNLIRRVASPTKILLELGTGESWPKLTSSYVDYMASLLTCLSNDVPDFNSRVAYLSFPTGCLIQETHNVNCVDHALCEFMSSLGFPLKGHNSDYADAATLHALRDAGLTALNVAPQLGVIVTRAYVTFARTYGYDLSAWEQAVYDGGRWKTWGSEKFSVELGGQYHLNELPVHFQNVANDFVKDHVWRVVKHYKDHFIG